MHRWLPLSVWVASLLYYSCWVLLSPFLDEDQPLQRLFPQRKYGIMISDVWASVVFAFCAFSYGWYVYFGDRKSLYGRLSLESEVRKRNKAWLAQHRQWMS
eukprot:Protomagalhaensia_sp_Gyna_25__1116@NODE_1545_length_1750_cov_54_481005_g1253_i0_p2_GENE_NODE_1545_length_1750_cov_54_481005_g1253_i0NODE_1545_length_1750_cov_54_481005_g1253_i0_p2_ORF_typecomplete_len101_score7_78DPM2/PF07297_12/9_9e13_NODE_1545_length_1750_cov_54_481005_g1253_i096398